MENKDNIAGLGKNHDRAAHDHDIAKKQSEAQPATENNEMEPYSVNKHGGKDFNDTSSADNDPNTKDVHEKAAEYAKKEHEKADDWENNNETGPDSPQF